MQCAEFNNWVFPEDGKVHRWIAYNLPEGNKSDKWSSALRRLRDLSFPDLKASENPCALYCISDTNLVASLRPKVVDGTTCYRGIRDICVGGVCKEIPCDLNMESTAVEDVCGVCRGDSTSCILKQGTVSFMAQPRKKEKILRYKFKSKNTNADTKISFCLCVLNTNTTLLLQSKNHYQILKSTSLLKLLKIMHY